MSTMADGVVLCFDSSYTWPACVAAQSVIASWSAPEPLMIYCLCDGSVTSAEISALEALGAHGSAHVQIVQRSFDFPDMRIGYIPWGTDG
jgi:lipopolysaccharide biosynthesis glycosyltransferase